MSNKEQWKLWIKMLNVPLARDSINSGMASDNYDSYLESIIKSAPNRYKKIVALALSLAKWKSMSIYLFNDRWCGLCHYENLSNPAVCPLCGKCPLRNKVGACVPTFYGSSRESISLYMKAVLEIDNHKKRVSCREMEKVVEDLYNEEYYRLFPKE